MSPASQRKSPKKEKLKEEKPLKEEKLKQGKIRNFERDPNIDGIDSYNGFDGRNWPTKTLPGWKQYPEYACLYRTFSVPEHSPRNCKVDESSRQEIFEAMIRLPSAPINGIRRPPTHRSNAPKRYQHTLRLLRAKTWSEDTPPPVKRIYLFNNGLNETDNFDFFYRLADQLTNDSEAACIIHPFPGHLTRFPFNSRYTATPLDSYLDDSTNLFRQYLRYMLETRWLLSILAPMQAYQVLPGMPLLEERTDGHEGRSNSETLAQAIYREWECLNKANPWKVKQAPTDSVHPKDIEQTIHALRHLTGWKAIQSPTPPPLDDTKGLSPYIHAVGYSLGGFIAQATFFTWPYAVSSCTTICSGGALRDIAITTFAYPEEWQMVIRGLRHGMNEAFSDRTRINSTEADGSTGDYIAGVVREEFNYLSDIFRDIFLQDDVGSYRTRVKEFVKRLFFVVGGNDPIVSVRSVQEAKPTGGINMLEVADLDHFVSRAMEDEAQEWRGFWFPQVSQLIKQFSARCESIYHKTLFNNWYLNDPKHQALTNKVLTNGDKAEAPVPIDSPNIILSSAMFQSHLGMMVDKFLGEKTTGSRSSCLFIFRNEIPAPLLNNVILRQQSLAIHHADDEINAYLNKLLHWQDRFKLSKNRMMLVVQNQWFNEFKNGHTAAFRKLDGAGANKLSKDDLELTAEIFINEWCSRDNGFLRLLNTEPDQPQSHTPNEHHDYFLALEAYMKNKMSLQPDEPIVINTLPEIVIYVSGKVIKNLLGRFDRNKDIRSQLAEKMPSYLLELYSQSGNEKEDKKAKKTLTKWIKDGEVMLIQLSRADFNPRHRGVRVMEVDVFIRLLTHCTLAYARSQSFDPQKAGSV